jgi:hypothetical protein
MRETPDSMLRLVSHVEHCEKIQDPTQMRVVWRNNELTATLTPEVGETGFAQTFTNPRVQEDVVETIPPLEEEPADE